MLPHEGKNMKYLGVFFKFDQHFAGITIFVEQKGDKTSKEFEEWKKSCVVDDDVPQLEKLLGFWEPQISDNGKGNGCTLKSAKLYVILIAFFLFF